MSLQRRLVVTWLHGATWNYCHLGARSVYIIQPCTSLQSHFIRSHTCRFHINMFICNFPLALLAEWPGAFTCYCGNARVGRIPKWESAQNVDLGEEIPPATAAWNRTSDLSITSPAVYHWAIPVPHTCVLVRFLQRWVLQYESDIIQEASGKRF